MPFNPDQPRGPDGQWIRLAGLMKTDMGFTHVLDSGETNPSKGIAVGIPSPDGKDWMTREFGKTTPEDIAEFAEKFKDALSTPGRAIGGWSNDDPAEGDVRDALDVVEVIQDMEKAYAAAMAAEQDGVWDFEHGFISTEDLGKKIKGDRDMSTVYTPAFAGAYDFAKSPDGRVAFWKQILPKRRVHYTAKDGKRRQIDFDDAYLTDLASGQAVDKIGFLLADKDNSHTMDPERWRGEVVETQVRPDGLYGKIVFPSADAARAVIENPELGVSARIRENVAKSDGSTVRRGLIHVLGTLDPQVEGLSPWQTADLSNEGEDTLDLSNEEYEDMTDKTKTETGEKALADYTEEDIDKMTDEELDKFLAQHVPSVGNYTGDTEAEKKAEAEKAAAEKAEADAKVEKAKELAGAGADMSKSEKTDIDLANEQVAKANARAEEAMRRVADAEWQAERSALESKGVPPHALDLAAPVLNRADDMVIDLSNTDEDDVNVSAVIRGLLTTMEGTVDLSTEEGHNGAFKQGDGEDPDKALLDAWDMQS